MAAASSTPTSAWGVGLATIAADGTTLDTFFRHLGLGNAVPAGTPTESQSTTDERRGVAIVPTSLVIDTQTAPTSASDVYLRLHLLSHRLVEPRTINLDGAFGLLTNVAWTSIGPVAIDTLDDVRYNLLRQGQHLVVHGVDKFPRMTDYVVPSGVRIADASRVRLGAHLASGTTVMHEGFVNFNAGTLGPAMIEGRISAGVVVGKNSDLGGGCSTMGTLSGGNDVKISIGENCLLGANSGLGIPLGDNCIVEAGLYITGGSKVSKLNSNNELESTLKASELSGQDNLLFIRNSQTGVIEARVNLKSVALNQSLHSN